MKNKVIFFSSQSKGNPEHFLLFTNLVREIVCFERSKIKSKLLLLNNYIEKGYYIAGFICYETGGVFNEIILKNKNLPYFYFGIYKKPEYIKIKFDETNKEKFAIYNINDNINFDEYKKSVKKINFLLKNGEVYQINYCFKKKFRFAGDGFALFLELMKKQMTEYSAFICFDDYNILSLSPELFLNIKKNKLTMKPMKGTIIKGNDNNIKNIRDEKNLAENIMIVDLIRNDMGKICKPNSIKVPKKFTIEKYKTLYQMTSTITGKIKDKVKFSEIITALFPSGSVTGAPKRRAIQIINLLEKECRGIYTGTIGFFHKENAMFNICIRTPVINVKTGQGEMGIGSGIVYDSKIAKEYKECQGKANFFVSLVEDFKLFESILYNKKSGFFLFSQHIARLEDGCKKFGFKYNIRKIKKELIKCVQKIKSDYNFKIRIFINSKGEIKTDFFKISDEKKEVRLTISREKVNSKNVFLYYKTSKREIYERNMKKAKQNGYDEIVFLNERDELTECATSNIFIEKNGIFYTPPVKCGLLNGTYRQYLLNSNPKLYRERILYKKDLTDASDVFICNSVRGIRKALYNFKDE